MSDLTNTVVNLLKAGLDPNDLQKEFEEAVVMSELDWVLWGDNRWRKDTACSICGSEVPGICGHQNNPVQEVILRSEYKRREGGLSE